MRSLLICFDDMALHVALSSVRFTVIALVVINDDNVVYPVSRSLLLLIWPSS